MLDRFPTFRRYADALAFSPTGHLLAAGGRDGEVRVWDMSGRQLLADLDWEIGCVYSLAFAPDGMTVAAAGHRSRIVVWDVE